MGSCPWCRWSTVGTDTRWQIAIRNMESSVVAVGVNIARCYRTLIVIIGAFAIDARLLYITLDCPTKSFESAARSAGRWSMLAVDMQHFEHPQLDWDALSALIDRSSIHRVSSFDGLGLISEVEEAFRSALGVDQVAATNSGTSALYAAFFALGLGEGDEVIVPAYTFFATAMPLFRLGCVPVLADCGVDGNIAPEEIERRVTTRTRAVVVTHMWGIPCDMERIGALAERRGIAVVEDASHAHGATLGGASIGSFGDASAWSLGAKKIVTGGQGGMLRTREHAALQRALLLTRANDKSHDNLIAGSVYEPYAVTGAGMNLRMHPFSAGLIVPQLRTLHRQLDERRESVRVFLEELGDREDLVPPAVIEGAEPSWYALPMVYRGSNRDEFVDRLHAAGAVDVDVPGSTRPLPDFPVFSGLRPAFEGAPSSLNDPAMYPNAAAFQASIVKYPSWYGPRANDFARAYAQATRTALDCSI